MRYSISNTSGLTTADGARHAITEVIFSINSTSAELHVSSDLERETDYHYYELIVREMHHCGTADEDFCL